MFDCADTLNFDYSMNTFDEESSITTLDGTLSDSLDFTDLDNDEVIQALIPSGNVEMDSDLYSSQDRLLLFEFFSETENELMCDDDRSSSPSTSSSVDSSTIELINLSLEETMKKLDICMRRTAHTRSMISKNFQSFNEVLNSRPKCTTNVEHVLSIRLPKKKTRSWGRAQARSTGGKKIYSRICSRRVMAKRTGCTRSLAKNTSTLTGVKSRVAAIQPIHCRGTGVSITDFLRKSKNNSIL